MQGQRPVPAQCSSVEGVGSGNHCCAGMCRSTARAFLRMGHPQDLHSWANRPVTHTYPGSSVPESRALGSQALCCSTQLAAEKPRVPKEILESDFLV